MSTKRSSRGRSVPLIAAAPPAVAAVSRRRLTSRDAKDTILDAAEHLLTVSGPQALKLADIARASGVTNGNVLHHFGTIEGVQDALMTRMVDRLTARVLKITEAPWTEDQRMTMGIREVFDVFAEPSAARLAAWMVMTDRVGRLDHVRDSISRVMIEILRVHATGPRKGRAQGDVVAFVMLGVLNALSVGLYGPALSQLFGQPDTAARDAALFALLTLPDRGAAPQKQKGRPEQDRP